MKLTKEIALITAVSVLKIFRDKEKEVKLGKVKINSRSLGEKSPSGPINMKQGIKVQRISIVVL